MCVVLPASPGERLEAAQSPEVPPRPLHAAAELQQHRHPVLPGTPRSGRERVGPSAGNIRDL